ncbi:cold shock and DUF1294 domain-containing protein [Wielerella bovis]|uniref:DUF1294 domain-containing protein n=1 Tax=Wielerella bovis TaxID=2917790 RepID=UPI0020193626|nr:cold shock and DUF1294 domain-containing protein [Wielerella bovis]ULJ63106.1 cold shock and DUF1294 domain-containing protein [Wielerella bovis]
MYQTAPDYDTKSKLHLGVTGNIVQWNAEKGYGFIQTAIISDNIFFHINTLVAPDHAPKRNETITVHAQYDANKKRWSASKVTSPQREQWQAAREATENALIRPMKDKLTWAIPVAVIWLAGLFFQAANIGICAMIVSLVAFATYAWDKSCALNQRSRVPEKSLHVIALCGGWAGALLARYVFRHKTQKQPFVGIFWATVAINILITLYFIFSGSLKGFI